MELVADGPLHYEQPVSATSVTVTAEAREGQYQIFATAQVMLDIAADGTVSQAGDPTGSASIVFEILQENPNFVSVLARHPDTGAIDVISVSAEATAPTVVAPLSSGIGRSLDLIHVYGESADLSTGIGRSVTL